MKIVDKEEFYYLPAGTLYSDYIPCIISGLKVKGETIFDWNKPVDFCYNNLIGELDCDSSENYIDILLKSEKEKTEFKLDFSCGERDGLYKNDTLYVIYSAEEIKGLTDKINSCIGYK